MQKKNIKFNKKTLPKKKIPKFPQFCKNNFLNNFNECTFTQRTCTFIRPNLWMQQFLKDLQQAFQQNPKLASFRFVKTLNEIN